MESVVEPARLDGGAIAVSRNRDVVWVDGQSRCSARAGRWFAAASTSLADTPGGGHTETIVSLEPRYVMHTDPDCLFCRVAAGDIPADIVLETEHVVAFRDIKPQAPTHVLLIPREHIVSLDDLEPRHGETLGRLFLAARRVAHAEGLEGGWRTVVNVGEGGGQSVFHLHVHLMGGRALSWPPG